MTLETCKKRYELAKSRENAEEMQFWRERIERRIARFPKFADVDIDELLGEKEAKTKKRGK